MLELLHKCKDVSDDSLLTWAGFESKRDYEKKSNKKFIREDFIKENYKLITWWIYGN